MSGLVLDTHVVIWYLFQDPKLSAPALESIREASRAHEPIYVPTIEIVEVIYLIEKGRIPGESLVLLQQAFAAPVAELTLAPLDWGVTVALRQIERDAVPDMPDRIIAATAVHLGLPLVTADGKIRRSGIATIW